MWFLAATASSEAVHAAGHELPMAAPILFKMGPLLVTNSMVVTWIVALALIVLAQLCVRNIRAIPGSAQNFVEWVVESLLSLMNDVLGEALARRTFWFFATIFFFILSLNWFGLLPGVGTVGYGVGPDPFHLEIAHPFLRGGNADLNMTLAMSLVFFALWIVWAFQYNGPVGVVKHIFGSQADAKGVLGVFFVILFLAIGLLEVLSILLRPVALTFRLYGNIYAGEVMMEKMSTIVPGFGWIVPFPFYMLELLVGFIQALVFCLLTAAFTALMCRHDDISGGTAH